MTHMFITVIVMIECVSWNILMVRVEARKQYFYSFYCCQTHVEIVFSNYSTSFWTLYVDFAKTHLRQLPLQHLFVFATALNL